MSDPVGNSYEPIMNEVRRQVAEDAALATLTSPTAASDLIERFLIEYCAQGVKVTEPVEGWIRRAGERCMAFGMTATGTALIKHAVHEAGHHLMFVEDTRFLVARWNQRHAQQLDAERLFEQPATPGMLDYMALHEELIASEAPFAQVAVEYEVERMSVDLLPQLIQAFAQKLGSEVLGGLSFLTEHAALDVGHTELNRKMMGRLLSQRPDVLPDLLREGERALRAYMRFIAECLSVAEHCTSRSQSLTA